MQVDGAHADVPEVVGEAVLPFFVQGEDNAEGQPAPAGPSVEPGVGWDDEHVVVHLGHRARLGSTSCRAGSVRCRRTNRSTSPSSVADSNSRWPPGGVAVALGDDRVEAQIAQVVGLVQGHDLDVVETAEAASDQVVEATGGGDDEVDALRSRRIWRSYGVPP